MKTVVILLLIFLYPSILISQQNKLFPKESTIWNVYEIVDTGPLVKVDISRFGLFGDTLINGFLYSKLFKINNDSTLNLQNMQYFAAIRENAKGQVFVKQLNYENEILIYDFSLNIGDTVLSNAQEGYLSFDNIIVSNIDTVEIYDGTLRKRIQLGLYDYWIEGIGSVGGLMMPVSNKPVEPQYSSKLICMKSYDKVVYLDAIYCEYCFCSKLTAIDENINKNEISVYPNPFNDNIFIKSSNTGSDKNYSIYSIEGKLIEKGRISSFPKEIQTQNLNKGCYVIYVNIDGKTSIRKIIKY